MFLVEIKAGREAVYDSVKDLAEAIRRGEVGPQARIFHRASSNWIPITLHPEFKKAAAKRARESLPPLPRSQWTFLGVEPKGREIDEPPTMGGDAGQTAGTGKTSTRRAGLRALFGRVLRSLTPTPKTTDTSGS
jgi:hypothetical protein